MTRAVHRNTTLAVFFVRKVPAPFTLVNIAIGATAVRYVDFILGTLLGMGVMVIALAGFGYQLTQAWRNPSPASLGGRGTVCRCAADLGVVHQPGTTSCEARRMSRAVQHTVDQRRAQRPQPSRTTHSRKARP